MSTIQKLADFITADPGVGRAIADALMAVQEGKPHEYGDQLFSTAIEKVIEESGLMPRWISVDDELPQVGEEILAVGTLRGDYIGQEKGATAYCVYVKALHSCFHAVHPGYYDQYLDDVTKWMRLPEKDDE